jgi:hypothetical protein
MQVSSNKIAEKIHSVDEAGFYGNIGGCPRLTGDPTSTVVFLNLVIRERK